MELHDIDGRLQQALRILQRDAGFANVIVEQDTGLSGSSLWMIYCTRAPHASSSKR